MVQLLVVTNDDEGHLHVTEDTQLISLLQQTVFSLAEGDLRGGERGEQGRMGSMEIRNKGGSSPQVGYSLDQGDQS